LRIINVTLFTTADVNKLSAYKNKKRKNHEGEKIIFDDFFGYFLMIFCIYSVNASFGVLN
jgi:hypothetical protein